MNTITTLYTNKEELKLDLIIYASSLEVPFQSLEERKKTLYEQFKTDKPLYTLDLLRFSLSDQVENIDYEITQSEDLVLGLNEDVVDFTKSMHNIKDNDDLDIDFDDLQPISKNLEDVFLYEANPTDDEIQSIVEKYNLITGEELHIGVATTEKIFNSVSIRQDTILSDAEIDNLSDISKKARKSNMSKLFEVDIESNEDIDIKADEENVFNIDNDFGDIDFTSDEFDIENDNNLDDISDSLDDLTDLDNNVEALDDENIEFSYDFTTEEDSIDDFSSNENLEDKSLPDELMIDTSLNQDFQGIDDEDLEEIPINIDISDNVDDINELDFLDDSTITEIDIKQDLDNTNKEVKLDNDTDFDDLSNIQFTETQQVETNTNIVSQRAGPQDDIVKEDKNTNIQQPIEDIPKDLRKFLRKYPRSDMDFVLQYFSKKEVNDAIRMGKIIKKGNTLRI